MCLRIEATDDAEADNSRTIDDEETQTFDLRSVLEWMDMDLSGYLSDDGGEEE